MREEGKRNRDCDESSVESDPTDLLTLLGCSRCFVLLPSDSSFMDDVRSLFHRVVTSLCESNPSVSSAVDSECRGWLLTDLLIDSAFDVTTPPRLFKLLKLHMLLSLVSGAGPAAAEEEEDDAARAEEEGDSMSDLTSASPSNRSIGSSALLARGELSADALKQAEFDFHPLTLLVLSGGSTIHGSVASLVSNAASFASDCTGAASALLTESLRPPGRIRSQLQHGCGDQWSLMHIRAGMCPLSKIDVDGMRGEINSQQAASAASSSSTPAAGGSARGGGSSGQGRGGGVRKSKVSDKLLSIQLNTERAIPAARESSCSSRLPPKVWLHATLDDRQRAAPQLQSHQSQHLLPSATPPLSAPELDIAKDFDLISYHLEESLAKDELEQCAAQSIITSQGGGGGGAGSGLHMRSKMASAYCDELGAGPKQQAAKDKSVCAFKEWISHPAHFRQFIAMARTIKVRSDPLVRLQGVKASSSEVSFRPLLLLLFAA